MPFDPELYSNTTYFKLTINNIVSYVDEPSTWDKITIENLRDNDFFGMVESFVSDKQQLEFNSDVKPPVGTRTYGVAYDLIKACYDAYGSDGLCVLEFGINSLGIEYPQYTANLNLNTYHAENGTIKCSVEKLNFNDLFRTRYSTSITLSNPATLDSYAMTSIPTPANLLLRSKVLSQQLASQVFAPESADSGKIARFVNVQPDTSSTTISELDGGQGLPLGISGIDPRDQQRYFFSAPSNGSYVFNEKVAFTFQIVTGLNGVGNSPNLVPRFMIQRQAVATATVRLSPGQISGTGIIGAVLTAGGAGYTYTEVFITGDGAGATAICAIANGAVVSINITNPGAGYTHAEVNITGDGAGATATISDGVVLGCPITYGGAGCTVAYITIDGDGQGATATCGITNGAVTSINMDGNGTGYTYATATITGDFTISTTEYSTFPNNCTITSVQAPTPMSTTYNFAANLTLNRTLLKGDLVYLDFTGVMQHDGASYYYYVTNYTGNVTVTGQTTTANTNTNAYRLFDAIVGLLNATTNQANGLISSVLSEGGRCYNYFITNGYQIRNFEIGFKPVITTLKAVIESICAIFGLGYGFTTRAGTLYLLIEDISFFYKNVQAGAPLENISEYYEEHAADFVFNNIVMGYQKYPTLSTANGTGNTLDEFNTSRNILMPITTVLKTFTKTSTLITSGYASEIQRREQFKINPSQSLSNDDDIFLYSCEVVDGVLQTESDEAFTNVTGVLSPDTSINLRTTPMRMFFNWSPYLSIGLSKKPPTANIITTLAVDNNTLVSSLSPNDPNNKYEPAFPVNESGTYTYAQYIAKNGPIHLPIFSYFKSEMNYSDVNALLDQLTFSAGTPEDGGYVVYPDDLGNIWKGYVYQLTYDPYLEQATFKCAKIGPY